MLSLFDLSLVGSLGAAPAPEPLAYVSSGGSDTTGRLDDAAHPFKTIDGATRALVTEFLGEATTVILQTNLTAITESFIKEAYTDGASLTLDGAGFNISVLELPVPTTPGAVNLTLKDVVITSAVVAAGCPTDTTVNFGTIHHEGTVSVNFDFSRPGVPSGDPGAAVSPLPDGVGATGTNGSASPGTGGPGQKGESFNLTGTPGNHGQAGKAAWSCTLDIGAAAVAVTHSTLTGNGCGGGAGGTGGGNSGLTGGTGGRGGDGADDGMGSAAWGGNGGDGGDCYLTGGDGGNGGRGGDGSVITYTGANKATALTTGTTSLSGGLGGAPGSGGSVSASGGAGGSGGDPFNGGSSGSSGNPGNWSATNGNAGSQGTDGTAGSVIP